jgi:DNA-binding NarL/FixJ family response regulator
MSKIRVALVEDEINWLKMMTNYLNKDDSIIVVGTATNKEDAINLARLIDIDILIMDINLSGNKSDGILAALEIMQFTKIKIIMLTSLNNEELITDSFAIGAVNYISKSDYREIPNAIHDAYKNSSPFQVLIKDYCRLKSEEHLNFLTPAEKEIFKLLEQGYSKSQIEKELYKSPNTLKTQIKGILSKLGVVNCKEAVKKVHLKWFVKEKYNK